MQSALIGLQSRRNKSICPTSLFISAVVANRRRSLVQGSHKLIYPVMREGQLAPPRSARHSPTDPPLKPSHPQMQCWVQPCTCSPQSDHQIHKQAAQQRPPFAPFASLPLRFHSAPSDSAVQRKRIHHRRFAVARAAHDNGRSNPAKPHLAPEASTTPPQRP